MKPIREPDDRLYYGKITIEEGEEKNVSVWMAGENLVINFDGKKLGLKKSLLMDYPLRALIQHVIIESRKPEEVIKDNEMTTAPEEVTA